MTELKGENSKGDRYATSSGNEISLTELAEIFIRKKFVIAVSVVGAVLLAVIAIVWMKPVYESRAVLLVGAVGPRETPQLLTLSLMEQYQRADFPSLQQVEVMKEYSSGIELISEAYTAKEAKDFLAEVVDKTLLRHQQLFELNMHEQNMLIDSLQDRVGELERELRVFPQRISSVGKNDPSMAGLLMSQMAGLSGQLLENRKQLSKLQLEVSEWQTMPTKLLSGPTLESRPVKPRKMLYLVLAAAVGLFIGIFSVLAAELVCKRGGVD